MSDECDLALHFAPVPVILIVFLLGVIGQLGDNSKLYMGHLLLLMFSPMILIISTILILNACYYEILLKLEILASFMKTSQIVYNSIWALVIICAVKLMLQSQAKIIETLIKNQTEQIKLNITEILVRNQTEQNHRNQTEQNHRNQTEQNHRNQIEQNQIEYHGNQTEQNYRD